ncbi:hypothetical protein scyTo_0020206, partial [Scyliorhinus torazame]|nr:hypothetical protein [Scyliorhinus torazame]
IINVDKSWTRRASKSNTRVTLSPNPGQGGSRFCHFGRPTMINMSLQGRFTLQWTMTRKSCE